MNDEAQSFHRWMQKETDLSETSQETYRKAVYQLPKPINPADQSVDEILDIMQKEANSLCYRAALKKYLDYKHETGQYDQTEQTKLNAAKGRLSEIDFSGDTE